MRAEGGSAAPALDEPQAPPAEGLGPWRKQQREALIRRRLAAGAAARQAWSESIAERLREVLPPAPGRVLGFCWPYQGEPDLVATARRWATEGGVAALPVVLAPRTPMIFRRWHAEARMQRGVYDIPVPAGTEAVHPDVLLVPLTGFDDAGYRLGYGGGFFDRTIATLEPRPQLIGVGFELSRLDTIFPQPHDLPMHCIVTEAGVRQFHAGSRAMPAPRADRRT
jgi:5-formyltetrahydrofolate cyclo-ligase